jgi:hypothetical protein
VQAPYLITKRPPSKDVAANFDIGINKLSQRILQLWHSERSEESRIETMNLTKFLAACGSSE